MGKHKLDWLILAVSVALLGCGGRGVDVSVTSNEDGSTASGSAASNTTDANGSGTPAATPEKRGTIGYSAMDMGNPFFEIIADNLRRDAAAAGFDLIVENADRDVKAQAEHLDAFIAKRVVAIVMNPCDRESAGPSIKRANEQGIPVFTCDTQCVAEGIKIAGHVGTDNFGGGILAGEAMVEVLGENGGKVFIVDFPSANSCVLRVEGFRQIVDAHNKGREKGRIEIVGQQDGGGEPSLGKQVTEAAIQANPDLAAVFAINDPSGLGAHTALEQAGKNEQVTIIAFDGHKEGKQAIKDGKFFADPIQFPDRMGILTMENIVKYLKGEEFEKVTLLPTALYRKADADKDPELEQSMDSGDSVSEPNVARRAPAPLLRMTNVSKSFPGVHALKGIDLELHGGEVLALLGENGAGKSTLIKILGGAQTPDKGEIEIDGKRLAIANPLDAERAGIGIIYQEFNLVPELSARENIFLGQEGGGLRWLPLSAERRRAEVLFERIGVPIDVEARCGDLTIAQQQVVEIAKALLTDARIIVMDEPSATLTLQEVDRLFAIIQELKSQGIGVIYISHRLDEIFAVADRVMVMRDGQHVDTRPIGESTRENMIELMVGRTLEEEFPKQPAEIGEPRLAVRGLCRGTAVQDVSFEVRRGEIVGLTGLVGAGRTETARLIFGADRLERGTIELDGVALRLKSPRDAIAAGVCLLTEDRKSQGLVLEQTVRENFGLPNLARFSRLGFLNQRSEGDALAGYVDSLQIKVTGPEQRVGTLSGGNQQKVVLAKWLERNADVIIFDEPTRGIDVGAKFEIYLLMNRLAAAGKAILMISSELPEVIGMSDRILVMHEGRLKGEITDVAHTSQKSIMQMAVGTSKTAL